MKRRWTAVWGLVVWVVLVLGVGAAHSAEREVSLELHGAVIRPAAADAPAAAPSELELDLLQVDGKWTASGDGFALEYNKSEHEATIVQQEVQGDASTLHITMRFNSDAWTKPAAGEYRLRLRVQDATVQGDFDGTFEGQPVAGKITGTIRPRPQPPEGFAPPRPQEHPRLLLRKSEIPALRQKASTPQGQAILQRLEASLSNPREMDGSRTLGHALLWVLKEDTAHLEAARKILADPNRNLKPEGRGSADSHAFVYHLCDLAMAYDLIYDQCDEALRTAVTRNFEETLPGIMRGSDRPDWNPTEWSNWQGLFRGGVGVVSLVLLDEPKPYFAGEGGDQIARDHLKIAVRKIRRYARTAVGEHGWNTEGEGYTQHGMGTSMAFAHAYKNVMGLELCPEPNMGMVVPLYAMKMAITEHHVLMPANGMGWPWPDRSTFSLGFGRVPPPYQPAVLWTWKRLLAMKPLKGDTTSERATYDEITGLVFELVNWPDGMQEKNPAEVFGRVWVDQQKGGYIFRNRWQDGDDLIASFFLKKQWMRSVWQYKNAGELQIQGLGRKWIVRGTGNKNNDDRSMVNAVQVSDPINGSLGGRETYFQSQTDGSGIVTCSLDDVMLGRKDPRQPLADFHSRKNEQAVVDLGIRATRGFAVDYSGKSGAAGLYAVVDRMTGGGEKTWQAYVNDEHAPDPNLSVSILGNSFVLRAEGSDATLRGTFIAPAKVQIWFDGQAIRAKGGDEFFIVMTLQRGTAPDVKVVGEGLAAIARTGEQTVRWDDQKLVLGEAAEKQR